MRQDNQYAAFLADFTAGRLSDGERLAARLHCAISEEGARNLLALEAAGGALIEAGPSAAVSRAVDPEAAGPDQTGDASEAVDWVHHYAAGDLMGGPWRRSLFGVRTRRTHLPTASLLRLDPGKRAPRHSHGAPDVTVVLRGAFADPWGEYRRGDLAFASAGDRHAPEVIGDEACICLIATPEGRPLVDVRGWLGGLFRSGSQQ